MTDIIITNPADRITVTLDWNEDLAAGISLLSVTHTVPSPLTKESEATIAETGQSQVTFHGALHGRIYQILGSATLNDGETLSKRVPIRGWDS